MYDFIIIGGGPIGMNAAIALAKENYKVIIIDNCEQLGGQLMMLYPQKEIVDIPDIPSITAKDYIEHLKEEIDSYDNIEVILNEKVIALEVENKTCIVKTNSRTIRSTYAILATGLGAFIPRKMGVENEDTCNNILYSLNDLNSLKGKRVLVLGGGDSALDWTKEISKICDEVTIIHRRREFRGDFKTIANLNNVIIKTPYVPYSIKMVGNNLKSLIIKNVETEDLEELPADFVFVNYGFLPSGDFFNLSNENGGLIVNSSMQTSNQIIFALGDVARYDNKIRRIAPGLKEIEALIKAIKNK